MAKRCVKKNSPPSFAEAGGTYSASRELELRATPELRAAGGSWFTPPGTAEDLFKKAAKYLPSSEKLDIVDPSCGGGVFAEILAACCKNFSFTGYDIDPDAAEFCKKNFTTPQFRFLCTDTLLDDRDDGPFDLVIGNPPFVALPMIPEDMRKKFRKKYTLASGRFNLWSLFIEWSIKKLRPGGIGALILPDRLWRNTSGGTIRDFLENNTEILEYGEYPAGTFPDAVVDSGYVIFSAGGTTPEEKRLRRDFCEDDQLISSLSRVSLPLGDILDIRDGIIPGHHAKDIFLDALPTDSVRRRSCRKLLTGRDVYQQKIVYRGRYADYRPEVWNPSSSGDPGIRLRKKEIFESPKILTRQTADSIIAAWDAAGEYYYANTLHGGRLKTADISGEFLAAYLSGPAANHCYKHVTGETGRPFAQVKIALLKTIPVPVMDKKEQNLFLQDPKFLCHFANFPEELLSVD